MARFHAGRRDRISKTCRSRNVARSAPNSEWRSYLDPVTGEIVTATEDDRYALDAGDDEELPDWQQESIAKLRELEASGRCLDLPDKFDIHDWSIMERFSEAVDDPDDQEDLLRAIHGRGAFRIFRDAVERMGRRNEWLAFRDGEYRRIAREWLEEHEIPYK